MRKIMTSPLVHFFALGALIFAAFAILDDAPAPPPPDAITLTPPQAARLAERFAATWRRPPTPEELDGLMRSWALEEANVREALTLNLDTDDTVIRQRLNLKMRFLAESSAAALAADDGTLEAFLRENPDRFMRPARLAFDQILLPPDSGPEELSAMRTALENGADPTRQGAATLLPFSVPLTPASNVDQTFGDGFHAALNDLPSGSWQGPVESAYGRHLVRVTERTGAKMPPFAEIRDAVEAEWRAARTREAREAFGKALLERYTVTLPAASEVLMQ